MNRWALRALATVNLSSSDNSSIPNTQRNRNRNRKRNRNKEANRNTEKEAETDRNRNRRTEKLFENRAIKDEFLKR